MTDKQIDKHIPRLRFPEFHNDDEWTEKSFGDCLEYEQPQPYLVASDNYKKTGTPVLTAGKTFVLGYTDEITGIYNHLPVIIFDDFTTASKFVDFPFKAKSSAMKMLQNRSGYDLRFMFETIQKYKFEPKDHQRHWISIFSQFRTLVPSYSEQQKIAECLSSIDSYISSINEKIEQLKAHKKSLMQKLFPQNGRTVPEYRFPEFEKDGAWVEIKVSDIFEITRGHVLAASNTKPVPDDEYRYPVFSSQTAKNGLMGYYNKSLYTDAITWTTDGANAGTVNYREGAFYCTNVCGVLLSNKGYANKCIAELLGMEAKKHVSYVGNPKLMNNVMAEIKFYIPSIREQQKIASCLSSIDMLRQVNTEKRVQLEKIKKGLVQHLFPQI